MDVLNDSVWLTEVGSEAWQKRREEMDESSGIRKTR
jgi:hypothetical protein